VRYDETRTALSTPPIAADKRTELMALTATWA